MRDIIWPEPIHETDSPISQVRLEGNEWVVFVEHVEVARHRKSWTYSYLSAQLEVFPYVAKWEAEHPEYVARNRDVLSRGSQRVQDERIESYKRGEHDWFADDD